MADLWQWLLDVTVAGLLVATLLRARRLERALSALQRDRGGLETLISGFDASTRQAQGGIERLRATAEGAARRMEQQVAAANALRDDLAFLIERGEQLAERLDHGVRAMRTPPPEPRRPSAPVPAISETTRETAREMTREAGRDMARGQATRDQGSRARSQAERDLLAALQAGR